MHKSALRLLYHHNNNSHTISPLFSYLYCKGISSKAPMEKGEMIKLPTNCFSSSSSSSCFTIVLVFILFCPIFIMSEGGDLLYDEEKELCYKGACDINASKGIADRIIPHLLNIYGANATARDFDIYAQDATFEDPLMCAHGIKQIKSAFYSIPKIFSESRIVDYSVREEVISSRRLEILMDNKQHYKILGKDINMISLIKLEVENGKIIRHEDRWDKKPLLNRETINFPLVGRILETTRRGSMLATHAMMRFGKDPQDGLPH